MGPVGWMMLSCVLFALALSSAGEVPVAYGLMACRAADAAGVERVELGALLLAENHGRRYNPTTRGRYGAGGEYGLMQLQGSWARFCGIRRSQLLDARSNLECGALVIAELKRWHGKYCRRRYSPHNWRVHWRCASSPQAWASQQCGWSVGRARRHQERLEARYPWTWRR
jgi:hypothetical protein